MIKWDQQGCDIFCLNASIFVDLFSLLKLLDKWNNSDYWQKFEIYSEIFAN